MYHNSTTDTPEQDRANPSLLGVFIVEKLINPIDKNKSALNV